MRLEGGGWSSSVDKDATMDQAKLHVRRMRLESSTSSSLIPGAGQRKPFTVHFTILKLHFHLTACLSRPVLASLHSGRASGSCSGWVLTTHFAYVVVSPKTHPLSLVRLSPHNNNNNNSPHTTVVVVVSIHVSGRGEHARDRRSGRRAGRSGVSPSTS